MSALPYLFALLAFVTFGLATDAHYRRRWGGALAPTRRIASRRGAWALIGLSLISAILAEGWVFGPVVWSGAVMTGAAATFLWLNLTPE